jgi:predicted DNA-binding protein
VIYLKTLSLKIDDVLLENLEKVSELIKRSKSFLIREALTRYLEDLSDVFEAENILLKTKENEWIDHEDIRKEIMGN